jgi:outer membrane protein OmpA-like peptidoglycan-associated protein
MMTMTQRLALALCGLLCAAGWGAVQTAQAADPPVVMKNSEVTESALIDALALEPPPAASGATRGFKLANPGSTGATAGGAAGSAGAAAAPRPAGPGRANLLIVFATNSAELTPESQSALDTVARAFQSDALAGLSFRVEGHADARGSASANMKLSLARAEAVVGYLVGKHGILPERLAPQGKGSAEPLNRERADAPENRRVTIVSSRG